MTVIAALVQDGHVHMAADTAAGIAGTTWHHPGKLFVVDVDGTSDRAVFGFAGNGALGAIARLHLDIPAAPESRDDAAAHHRWALAIAWDICRAAANADPAPKDSDGWIDGYALLGFRGRIYMLAQQDACEALEPFAAIGSGGDVALGAMSVLPGDLMPAREQLEAAIESACRFVDGCSLTPAGMRYEVV